MPRNKTQISGDVQFDAVLKFSDGKLIGWKFIAKSNSGKKVVDDLMSGKISGLKYCEKREIRPFAGGNGEYFIGFPQT
jgi:hypothetical protein